MKWLHAMRLLACTALSASAVAGAEPVGRLLVLGNSITLHPPSTALGWNGNWGMAASNADADYAHRLAAVLVPGGQRPVLYPRNISDFERDLDAYDIAKLDFAAVFRPDTVVVFLGDNVKLEQHNEGVFAQQYARLLKAVAGSARLYCVTTWWPNPVKDAAIASACRAQRGVVVDIKGISAAPGMKAAQQRNSGVAAHPSDAGMDAIANRIANAINGSRP